MNGLSAFLLGLVALLGAFLFGRAKGSSETVTKVKGEVTIEKAKAEKAEAERDLLKDSTPLVTEAVKAQAEARTEYDTVMHDIESARKTNDMGSLLEIARQMAQKALDKGATAK